MKTALAALLILVASSANAKCLCLKCATGPWHNLYMVSGGMKPTIEPDSCLFIRRNALIDRGAVVAFLHPYASQPTIMVFRLIGLPGNVIDLKGVEVTLTGVLISREAVEDHDQIYQSEGAANNHLRSPEAIDEGEVCSILRFTETLPNGVTFDALDLGYDSAMDDAGPFTVSSNHVFVLGDNRDNRDNSADSRFPQAAYGLVFIPAANILGPVIEITNPAP